MSYISREAAIEAICTEGTRLERNGTMAMVEIKQWCVDLLEQLPSADVRENIKGEWIKQYFDFRDNCQIYSCSKCDYQDVDTNFCPNCGADMRGEA